MTYLTSKSNSPFESINHNSNIQPYCKLITQAKPNTRASPIRSIDLTLLTPPKHLPPQYGKYKGRKTLVLDLDETLVHSTFQEEGHSDIQLPVLF